MRKNKREFSEIMKANLLAARQLCDTGHTASCVDDCDATSLGAVFPQIERLLAEISEAA